MVSLLDNLLTLLVKEFYMSEDDIDSLIVKIADFIDAETDNGNNSFNLEDDAVYGRFSTLMYSFLEPFCTRDRNYN